MQCTTCPANTFSRAKATSCIDCAPGQVSQLGSGGCTTCLAGTYADRLQSLCLPCPAGTYSAFNWATACTACELGTSTEGQSGQLIISCPPLREGEICRHVADHVLQKLSFRDVWEPAGGHRRLCMHQMHWKKFQLEHGINPVLCLPI